VEAAICNRDGAAVCPGARNACWRRHRLFAGPLVAHSSLDDVGVWSDWFRYRHTGRSASSIIVEYVAEWFKE
jgi:hypothetical protein